MDASRSEKERFQALNNLRPPTTSGYPQQYIDDGAALGGDVAIVAAQIASESNATGIRAGIWYTMTGVPDPVLIQPLIHSLGNDEVALVRERAALALAIHNYDRGAQAALESAANNDPDLKVRHAARLAASTEEGRQELLRQIIVDIDVPERERRQAIFHRSQLNDVDAGPPDEALIAAMVTFAKTASETRTRQMAWFRLGSMAGPEIVDDLIAALTDEPSETVREWIVTALKENMDEPGVRAALENTRLNDTSLLVRSVADRALRDAN
jgi:HEAT repeat protein